MSAVEIATIAGPIVAGLVGIGQIAVVMYGIRHMIESNQSRTEATERQAEIMERRTQAQERRADAQERRAEAQERHADAFDRRLEAQERADERRHAEAMAALDAQRRALEALIERTGASA